MKHDNCCSACNAYCRCPEVQYLRSRLEEQEREIEGLKQREGEMFAEAHRQIEFRNEAVRETVALQEKLRLAEELATVVDEILMGEAVRGKLREALSAFRAAREKP